MVLSNKKLKQRLRSLLAESLAAAEPCGAERDEKRDGEVSEELRNLKEAISAKKGLRPRPPRKKKSKAAKEDEPNSRGEESTVEGKHNAGGEDGKDNRSLKMKEAERVSEKGDSNKHMEEDNSKTKSKNAKKKKKKKEKKRKENKALKYKIEDVHKVEGETNGSLEPTKSDESEHNDEAAKKVYVGGIPYYSSEDDIRSFFESCGTISEMQCMTFPESGKFRGIAILTFKTEAAVKRALALDGADMGGLYLKIKPYTIKPYKSTLSVPKELKPDFTPKVIEGYNRVYVGNLSWHVTEEDLRNLFVDCNISAIRFGEDKVTKEFKGYAHVDFKDCVSLMLALKLDQQVVCGRPVKISCAVPAKNAGKITTIVGNAVKTIDAEKSEVLSSEVLNENGVSTVNPGNGKKKRRTCYECGIPGHLSSECPNKKTSDTAAGKSTDGRNAVLCDDSKMTSAEMRENQSTEVENQHTEITSSHGNAKKKKRRTCYQCGIPGHLLAECPSKKTTDPV